jgi:uncharacterized Zn finger protein
MASGKFSLMKNTNPNEPFSVETLFSQWSDAECRAVLEGLLDEVPEAVEWVWERELLKNANAKRLVTTVRNDLGGCEPFQDPRDRWMEGEPVDYDRICERLKVLLEAGHVEDVVDLGVDLLRAGGHELEHSHDNDWDIQYGVGECLKVVFQALKRSKRSPVERILWEIGMDLEDEYGLLGDREAFQSDRKPFTAEIWSEVADQLMDRLANMGKGDIRRRKKIVHQIILALRRSDRGEEMFDFLRQETGRSDCVLELGEQLILYGRVDAAVSVWMERVEEEIHKRDSDAYVEAGKYLQKIQGALLENDRKEDWRILRQGLRETHSRKRLFMNVLDRLDG